MKSWLAAYVRLYHEKKTRDRLTAMGIESFLPVQEEIHQWSDRRGQSTPAVIPDEQMERFRFMLDYSEEAIEVCSSPLAPGEQVRVIKGPLAGLEGELVTIDGKSKVAVRLDMLGCAHVDMPVGFVERVGKMEAVR